MDFDTMIKEAEKAIEKSSKDKGVATALLTHNGNLYITFCNDFCSGFGEKFCEDYTTLKDMIAAGETGILKIVCVYKMGQQKEIEIPCYWLRKFIYDINNSNKDAVVMLGSEKTRLLESLISSVYINN